MATLEDIYRLQLQVDGQRDAEELTKSLDFQRQTLLKLGEQYVDGSSSIAQYNTSAGKVADQIKKTETDLLAANKAAGNLKNGMAASGQSMMQTGRIFQDFTSGFQSNGLAGAIGAVTNNVEGFIQSLGGGAGLAGWLTIVAVGFQLLRPHIVAFYELLMNGTVTHFNATLEDMKARLEELEKKPHKLTIDYETIEHAKKEIDALQKALDAFKAMKDRTTTTQQKVAKAVQDTIAEHGGGTDEETGGINVRNAVRAAMEKEGTATIGQGENLTKRSDILQLIAEYQFRQKKAKANPGSDDDEGYYTGWIEHQKELLAPIEAAIDKATDENVARLVGRAGQGIDSARKQIQDLYGRNKALFNKAGIGDQFATGLAEASPDILKNKEVREADNAEVNSIRIQLAEQAEKRAEEAEAAFKKGADEAQAELDRIAADAERDKERGVGVEHKPSGFDVETTAAERQADAREQKTLADQLAKEKQQAEERDKKEHDDAIAKNTKHLLPDIQPYIDLYTIQNKQAQANGEIGALSDGDFDRRIRKMIAEELILKRKSDAEGHRITPANAPELADAIASAGGGETIRRFDASLAATHNAQLSAQALTAEAIAAVQRVSARVDHLMEGNQRLIRQARQIGNGRTLLRNIGP